MQAIFSPNWMIDIAAAHSYHPHMSKKKEKEVKKAYKPNRLRQLRRGRGLTLEELGEKSGIPFQTIARYEKRERKLTIDAMSRLAPHLKCEPWEIMADDAGAEQLEQAQNKDLKNTSLDALLDLYARSTPEVREMFDALHNVRTGKGTANTEGNAKKNA